MALELNLDVVAGEPRDAATVILLRDASPGLEVLLLRRAQQSGVLGGAYVFPGGKVDAADRALAEGGHTDTPSAELHATLTEPALPPAAAAALFVAAIRETFEESGILLAEHPQQPVAALAAQAAALTRDGLAFASLPDALALRLATRQLLPWSRWVTPPRPSVMNKRFDTRFFVAVAPEGQVARHDDHETTHSVWLAPRVALQQYWDGEIDLAGPQVMTLAHLARHADTRSVFAEARARPPAQIRPEPHDDNGQRVICYPGDPRHSVPQRAMPGPTRMAFANGRFEPPGGFDALFA